jgi:hypothetical protein
MSLHPEILSLQRLKDNLRDNELKRQNWDAVLESLWCWNIELKEEDQDKDLIDKIEKEQITLSNFQYPGGKKKRITKMKKTYKSWYTQTMKLTWEKGYFENRKYTPETKKDTTFGEVKKWNEDKQ